MSLFQPVGQIRHTNVAIVRIKKGGKKFEIACYKNKVVEWRNGVEKNLDEVMQIPKVFINVSKGEVAKKEELQKVFNTEDQKKIVETILTQGELQISAKEREQMFESMFKDIVTIVANKCINPDTQRPYPPNIIDSALKEIHFAVQPSRNTKQQALDAIKKLRKKIAIERAQMRVQITIASEASKKLKTILQSNKDNEIESDQYDNGQVTLKVLLDPGMFREVDDHVTGKQGSLEVLDACVVKEGEADIESETVSMESYKHDNEEVEENSDDDDSSRKKKKKQVEADDDDDSGKKKKKKNDDAPATKKKKSKGNSDDEQVAANIKPKKGSKKKQASEDEEEPEEDFKPKKKASKKKQASEDEDDAVEEDEVKPKKKKKQATDDDEEEPVKPKKKKKQAVSDDEEPAEDEVKPKKKKKQVASDEETQQPTKKKGSKKKQAEEEEVVPSKPKKKKKSAISEDDEPAPTKKKSSKKQQQDEEVEEPVKKKKPSKQQSEDEEEEEEAEEQEAEESQEQSEEEPAEEVAQPLSDDEENSGKKKPKMLDTYMDPRAAKKMGNKWHEREVRSKKRDGRDKKMSKAAAFDE